MFVKFLNEVREEVLELGNREPLKSICVPVLKTESIHKGFERLQVLKDINFKVSRGVGIMEEKGSIKSILLKTIVGLLYYDQYKMILHGSFRYYPQILLLFNDLTVGENIDYFSVTYGFNQRENISQGDELMKMLGYEQFKRKLTYHLSKPCQKLIS